MGAPGMAPAPGEPGDHHRGSVGGANANALPRLKPIPLLQWKDVKVCSSAKDMVVGRERGSADGNDSSDAGSKDSSRDNSVHGGAFFGSVETPMATLATGGTSLATVTLKTSATASQQASKIQRCYMLHSVQYAASPPGWVGCAPQAPRSPARRRRVWRAPASRPRT